MNGGFGEVESGSQCSELASRGMGCIDVAKKGSRSWQLKHPLKIAVAMLLGSELES